MLQVMYNLEPTGVGGELEASDVLRFCSAECRDKYHADHNAQHIIAFYGAPIDRIYENNAQHENVRYPDGTDMVLLCKGEEADAGDAEEVCNQCGVILEEGSEEVRYCDCGEPYDKDCNGQQRCPVCDPPCPCCYDGGGPN